VLYMSKNTYLRVNPSKRRKCNIEKYLWNHTKRSETLNLNFLIYKKKCDDSHKSPLIFTKEQENLENLLVSKCMYVNKQGLRFNLNNKKILTKTSSIKKHHVRNHKITVSLKRNIVTLNINSKVTLFSKEGKATLVMDIKGNLFIIEGTTILATLDFKILLS